jgi:very-short-patch-repair endonuclease
MSKQSVHRRVQTGRWRRCSRGLYFVDDRPFTPNARVRVAVWSYGEQAVASGLAAAFWHGLTRFAPDIVEVTVPRNSHGRPRPGVRVRRRDLPSSDVVERRGLRVTALPLTVIEAAVRRRGGATIVDSALQKRNVHLRELWNAHLRNKGRYGSTAARMLLQAADEGTRSEAERLFAGLLRKAGITGWRTNYPVGGYRVDFGFPKPKVAVEIDGLAFHSGAEDFQVDRERQNAIALCGWQVLRFTWLDLTAYPDRTMAILSTAIRRAGSPSA